MHLRRETSVAIALKIRQVGIAAAMGHDDIGFTVAIEIAYAKAFRTKIGSKQCGRLKCCVSVTVEDPDQPREIHSRGPHH